MKDKKPALVERAIEESFPIVEINRLAVPERNAFKPIYQMHKWFARRASCVFRAILLGCLKPAGTDIMEEFYKDHANDPDTNSKVILDPFMGGGTTVVEALRLGCKVIGIDLNPVAWFIVKTEVEPVDIEALKDAFERLAHRKVAWSGKSVKETLLEQYKTECPCCGAGREGADIIYTFWVKSAVCTNPLCKKQVPLFSDYIIAQKSPSIRYHREVWCPKCEKSFDWEIEPAALIAEPSLMVTSSTDSAGLGRGNKRWTYASKEPVLCPWCHKEVTPELSRIKSERKKVPLTVLLCAHCDTVWQYRGTVPEEVSCPICLKSYKPHQGNIPKDGWFLCPWCGHTDRIINSIRKLPEDELLPMRPYAIEGYCGVCGGNEEEPEEEEDFFDGKRQRRGKKKRSPDHPCHLTKNNGKFFKRITAADLARYQAACEWWEKEKDHLPYPKSEIPWGEKTKSGLIAHHYRYWHQMFNRRQLLCLATLLQAIEEEPHQQLKELLLSTFEMTTEANNQFTWGRAKRNSPGGTAPGGIFRRHDYHPKSRVCEQNVWGTVSGQNTFKNRQKMLFDALSFAKQPTENLVDSKGKVLRRLPSADRIRRSSGRAPTLLTCDARQMDSIPSRSVPLIVTDPPYAGNVNYSELSDFFYVWLRLALAKTYREFTPELTPKAAEIVENPTRGKTIQDFETGLTHAFSECYRVLDDKGLMVFTFHHSEGGAWEALLRSICNAGFEINGVYPIHGESETSLHLMDKEGAVSYDLIHICRKRPPDATVERRSWAGIRQEIRRRAREEIRMIEAGGYGEEPLSPADVNIILIGKCLELYSRHYGAVVDHEGNELPLGMALEEIRMMVDQLVTIEQPLPSELQDIDPESYVYLTCLCDRKEIKSDEVHKATRGILEMDELLKSGFIIKGRAKRGRTYEVKAPAERFNELLERFRDGQVPLQADLFGDVTSANKRGKGYFIDKVHLLMALAEARENLLPWLQRWWGEVPQIRAVCEYLSGKRNDWVPALRKIQDLLDMGLVFRQ